MGKFPCGECRKMKYLGCGFWSGESVLWLWLLLVRVSAVTHSLRLRRWGYERVNGLGVKRVAFVTSHLGATWTAASERSRVGGGSLLPSTPFAATLPYLHLRM